MKSLIFNLGVLVQGVAEVYLGKEEHAHLAHANVV